MSYLSSFRVSGQTVTLALTTAASSATLVKANTNDQTNYVMLMNTGADVAAIELSNSSTVPTPAIASTGNAGSFVLPPAMNFPIVIAAPPAPFYIKGISSGTNTLYVTPVQSD
jgi:hypothetical protein